MPIRVVLDWVGYLSNAEAFVPQSSRITHEDCIQRLSYLLLSVEELVEEHAMSETESH
jgi:hypothetical protein